MTIKELKDTLKADPRQLTFKEVITVIEASYDFTPTAFKNGNTKNEAGQNNGSCKVFAFAMMQELSVEETLACFGEFYFNEVLEDLDGTGHQNIRNFMTFGFDGLSYEGQALEKKG